MSLKTATVFPTDLHSMCGGASRGIYILVHIYSTVCCVKPSVDFHIGLNENANSFFATRCPFAAVKIAVSPVTAVHKAALHSQMLLYEMEMKSTNRTNHRRLASHKGGVLKNESLSESFGSR